MNITMFGHKHIPSREGGVEVVVTELSTRMASLGHRVTCYNRGRKTTDGRQSHPVSACCYNGVQLKPVITVDKKGLSAVTSSFFAAVRTAFSNADIVHIHAEGPAFMCWLPRLSGKRVVVTVHGLDWKRAKWQHGFGALYIKMGERMAVRFAHEIIVLSRNVQDYFLQNYNRSTTLIPNGIQIQAPVPCDLIRRNYGLTGRNYLLFLGRLVPEKGVHYLIKAYRNLVTDMPLVIAGGSSDSDEYVSHLKDLANGDSRIIFTNHVQGQTLEELYSNAYLYVLPSDLEGMPLTLLEAMSYGNCCVVSSIPECTEVVLDCAAIFPSGNITALKNTLQSLCDDSDLVNHYRIRTQNHISGKYDWDEITGRTLELYRQLL